MRGARLFGLRAHPGFRKIAPTIARDVDERMRTADEEMFGPVLVVWPYSEVADAIDYINQRPAPLVAYWYGPDDDDFRRFVRSTRSGGVARNDFAAQMIPSAAPFGGVGRSGMGAYHADCAPPHEPSATAPMIRSQASLMRSR